MPSPTKSQPMGFLGWREAISAPTLEQGSAKNAAYPRKPQICGTGMARSSQSSQRPIAVRARASTHRDQARREAVAVLMADPVRTLQVQRFPPERPLPARPRVLARLATAGGRQGRLQGLPLA